MTTTTTTRERNTGRYAFSRLERLCTCGHPLAVHTAERTRTKGVAAQPCVCDDGCDCECFTPAR